MKIFLTGATGFIGSALVSELIGVGHRVLGLARSEQAAKQLVKAGAEVYPGHLEDVESLRLGATYCDGVIHCAYDHDFSKMEENSRKEAAAITALGMGLSGSQRPLVITSVSAMGSSTPGDVASEDHYDPDTRNPRKATENAGAALSARGLNVSVVRLAQVHNTHKQGFVSRLVDVAREKGVSGYVDSGEASWAAVHLDDAVRLFRLAIEKQSPGSRYNGVAEEGIPLREIAHAIGETLDIPTVPLTQEEAQSHFGWLTMFATMDMKASSAATRARLGWQPAGPGLLDDLKHLRSAS